MSISGSGAVVGIDVGYSKTRSSTTAACLFEWTPSAATLRVHSGDPVGLCTGRDLVAVAFDGPICGSLERMTEYRAAEKMLTVGFQSFIGKPGQTSSGNGRKLNDAANALARRVRDSARSIAPASHRSRLSMEEAIVEAFPTSFLGVMLDGSQIPRGGARSDAYYEHLLGPHAPARPATNRLVSVVQRLLPGRVLPVEEIVQQTNHDKRAAIVCAITALCISARCYVAVGDARYGYIVLPPRSRNDEPGLQDWAWRLLEKNRNNDAGELIEEPEPLHGAGSRCAAVDGSRPPPPCFLAPPPSCGGEVVVGNVDWLPGQGYFVLQKGRRPWRPTHAQRSAR